jgi:hypothetical protein
LFGKIHRLDNHREHRSQVKFDLGVPFNMQA